MLQSTTIIAFDQHAATTVAAVLLPAHRTPAIHPLTSDVTTIVRFVARVQRQGTVTCCYEAGPCGFELQRALTTKGIPCDGRVSARRSPPILPFLRKTLWVHGLSLCEHED